MKLNLTIIILVGVLNLCLAQNQYTTKLKIGKHKIFVELADTDEKKETGLMFRKSMPDSCGMLFIHDYPEILSYWMKNTPLPLSIAFIGSDGIIVSIKDMTPFSLQSVKSDYPALYALETNQGWFKKRNIKRGDKIEF